MILLDKLTNMTSKIDILGSVKICLDGWAQYGLEVIFAVELLYIFLWIHTENFSNTFSIKYVLVFHHMFIILIWNAKQLITDAKLSLEFCRFNL